MSESRTVTGHTIVMVKLADGGEVAIRKGQALPEGVAPGELERLDRVGAFGEPKQADLVAQGARRLDAGGLTPQVTLAANPEPGDGPLLATDERELFTPAEKAEAERLAAEKAAAPAPNVNPQAPADVVVVAPAAPAPPVVAAPPAPPAPPAPAKAAAPKAADPPKK